MSKDKFVMYDEAGNRLQNVPLENIRELVADGLIQWVSSTRLELTEKGREQARRDRNEIGG